MLRKFVEGLVFGAGFAISFVAVWYSASFLIPPAFVAPEVERGAGAVAPPPGDRAGTVPNAEAPRGPAIPFHEQSLDDRIRNSSVIALARYEPAPDGRMKAVVKEFLKRDPDVTIYYDIGDEYPGASYYPKTNTSYGDGVIIFFVGSPAEMRLSTSFAGDRIRGLADLPVELLRKKCRPAPT